LVKETGVSILDELDSISRMYDDLETLNEENIIQGEQQTVSVLPSPTATVPATETATASS